MDEIPFEVGFDGEFIGIYHASTAEAAIALCQEEMQDAKFQADTKAQDRLKGMIAHPA